MSKDDLGNYRGIDSLLQARALNPDEQAGLFENDRRIMLEVINECRRGNVSNFQKLIQFSKGEVLREFVVGKNKVTEITWNKWYREWKKLQNLPAVEAGKEVSGEVKSDV